MTTANVVRYVKRLATLYEGPVAPPLKNNPLLPTPLWKDTSGPVPVLKMPNKAGDAWIAAVVSEADSAAMTAIGDLTDLTTTAKTDVVAAVNEVDAAAEAANDTLTALDTAMVNLVAVTSDLSEALVAADVDTADELAVVLNATNAKVNAVVDLVDAILVALKAIRSE